MNAPRVAVVMGVSGCGKSTLAAAIATAWPACYLDADDFHSAAARARMARGEPLTDRMRQPWVARLAAALRAHTARGERVALAFSGLRRRHRDVLRATGLPLRYLHLCGDRETIATRMRARTGHYMPVALLDSQFAALEPTTDEADVVPLPVDWSPQAQLARALALLAGRDATTAPDETTRGPP